MILPPFTRPLLYPSAKLYEFGVRLRAALYEAQFLKQRQLTAPVISVGNLTVGGTGKTPCVAFLARLLREAGYDVAILSRGYKRASTGRVEVSNGREVLCSAQEAGDEPFLLAQTCAGVRVVVDKDRYGAGKWLETRAPISVFLLDDGFQHLALARDLNLVLVDASEPLATARLLPYGRLREPLTALRRADAVIVTRADQAFAKEALEQTLRRYCRAATPVFYASHELIGLRCLRSGAVLPVTAFAGKPVAALCGIARPERFINDLQQLGMLIAWRRACGDHHRYTEVEFAEIAEQARAAGATALITTEKDVANLPGGWAAAVSTPVYAAQLAFRCNEEAALKKLVLDAVTRRGR